VEVWLARADFEPPEGRTITSGCGGGITFADLTAAAQPVASDLVVGAGQLRRLMTAMQAGQRTRGIHTAALADGEGLLLVAEDVGRHNTIDRIRGRCLLDGIVPEGKILLSTGRISSEMLHKAARMGTPVVASRTSPTSLSLALAEAWGITLVGYVRRDSLNIYTAPERVVVDSREQATGTPEEAWSDADA
jgi:FdhD protein